MLSRNFITFKCDTILIFFRQLSSIKHQVITNVTYSFFLVFHQNFLHCNCEFLIVSFSGFKNLPENHILLIQCLLISHSKFSINLLIQWNLSKLNFLVTNFSVQNRQVSLQSVYKCSSNHIMFLQVLQETKESVGTNNVPIPVSFVTLRPIPVSFVTLRPIPVSFVTLRQS